MNVSSKGVRIYPVLWLCCMSPTSTVTMFSRCPRAPLYSGKHRKGSQHFGCFKLIFSGNLSLGLTDYQGFSTINNRVRLQDQMCYRLIQDSEQLTLPKWGSK